jgi:hypothetical protein
VRLLDAPEFSLPAYVVYPSEIRSDFIDAALQGIQHVAMLEIPSEDRANVKLDPKPL